MNENRIITIGQNSFLKGNLQSPVYVRGQLGWQITEEGTAEFQDIRIGQKIISISEGMDIQRAINEVSNAGGGIVYMDDGIYTLKENLVIPSGVTLSGINRDDTVIDCNGSYSVTMVGSDAYTTGSITIAPGASTVTGSGVTAFNSSMIGQSIYLGTEGNFGWYEITGVTDTATITIGWAYTGPTLAGATYSIATPVTNPVCSRFSVTNATGAGVKAQYTTEININDVNIYSCGTGIDLDQCIYPRLYATVAENGVNVDMNEVFGFYNDFCDFSSSTTAEGVILNSCGGATFWNTSVSGNTGTGITIKNCTGITFGSVLLDQNTGAGIELATNCEDIQFNTCTVYASGSDGIRMTIDDGWNVISNSVFKNNTGYGVNLVGATVASTIVLGSFFYNNTAGSLLNAGTDTTARVNRGTADI